MDDNLKELIKLNFKEDIINIEKIYGGWLTEKWKVKFNNYSIMIKKICQKKIERRNIDIELAAKVLQKCNENEMMVPRVFNINGNLVNYDKDDSPIVFTEYISNTFCKDFTNVTENDIYYIGKEIAKLRKCLDTIVLKKEIDYSKIVKNIKQLYNERVDAGVLRKNKKYLNDVYKQKKIIDLIDIDFLQKYRIGICHRDLSSDNILFNENGFRAITDFELSNSSFVLVDIARIFLTFCLDNSGNINKRLLKKLIEGYNTFDFITLKEICMGLRILWCLEVNLWIKEAYYADDNPKKVDKFIFEINWITDNWFVLEKLIKI